MASTMFVLMIFIFSTFIHCTLSRTIDFDDEIAKINDELKGINQPSDQVNNILKNKLAAERQQIKQDADEKEALLMKVGELKSIKEIADAKDALLIKIGALESEKENGAKVLRMLGVRSRMESMADELWPGNRPFNVNLYQAYKDILHSVKAEFTTRDRILSFRQMIDNSDISRDEFLDTIGDLYSIFSTNVAQKLSFFPPVPKSDDVEGIKEMFRCFGMIPDTSKVTTVQLLLKVFSTLPKTTTMTTTTSTTVATPIKIVDYLV